MRKLFVLRPERSRCSNPHTDNGAEFSDEAAIAALLGEGPGETRLFYCDPRRSDQKGACERNHVEIRKLLPKGAGIRFDRLVPADLALAMSHVNSEPRGALGFATPARAFRAMLGEDAAALLDAYGVGDVPIGELDLTPGLIESGAPGAREGPRGRSVNCGSEPSAQCVRLRSEINPHLRCMSNRPRQSRRGRLPYEPVASGLLI